MVLGLLKKAVWLLSVTVRIYKQVFRCSKIAGVKVAEITELIQKALENDQRVR